MKTWIIVLLIIGLIVVAIPLFGALMYFGVMEPNTNLPERCLIGPEFECDYYSASASSLSLEITNNLGRLIEVSEFVVDVDGSSYDCSLSIQEVPARESFSVSCSYPDASFDSSRIQVPFSFEYQQQGSTFSRKASGEVFTSIN